MSAGPEPSGPARALAEAALDILARDGIQALNVRAVTAAAGMSTTGIYTHFGGKQGLLDALFADAFADFTQAMRASWEEARAREGLGPALRAVMRAYREWALAHPTQYLLMFGARAAGFAPSPAVGEVALVAYRDLVERVSAACEAGELTGDPESVAPHLWSAMHGYVMLELTGPGPAPEDAAAFFSDGVERLLAAHAAL